MSRVLLPIYFRHLDPDHGDLTLAILILGGIWPIIGAAGGAAFGIGLGQPGHVLRALLGGLLGALAGLLVYEIVGALAFRWTRRPTCFPRRGGRDSSPGSP